jgi:hypothetical protein
MSDTPRTDAEERRQQSDYENLREAGWPPLLADYDFARTLELDLAAAKVNADFWLAHEKQTNIEFERDYLAIWKAVKRPDMTVLDSALALKSELAATRALLLKLRPLTLQVCRSRGGNSLEATHLTHEIDAAKETKP